MIIRRIFFKIALASIIVALIILYYSRSIWAPYIYRGFVSCQQLDKSEATSKRAIEKQRSYYESLSKPKLSSEEIINKMKKEKGLHDSKIRRMVEWYLYNPLPTPGEIGISPEVDDANTKRTYLTEDLLSKLHSKENLIRQLVENLHFEVEIVLPEEAQHNLTSIVDNGESFEILRNRYNLLPTINYIIYEKLHEYSVTGAESHFIYLLLELKKRRPDGYDRKTRYKDMLAFLKIYAQYKEWPSIRERVKQDIHDYPGEWCDYRAIDEVLDLSDGKGAQVAYDLYLNYYRANFHHAVCYAYNSKKPDEIYRGEDRYGAWPGEKQIKGTFLFYNVDSNDVYIKLKRVAKVHSMVRNGIDITSLCSVKPPDITLVPLETGQLNKIEYIISRVCE